MSAVHNSNIRSGRPRKYGSGTKGTDYKNSPYEPAHGKWTKNKYGLWKCSVCQLEQIQVFPKCPMCGAVMDKW